MTVVPGVFTDQVHIDHPQRPHLTTRVDLPVPGQIGHGGITEPPLPRQLRHHRGRFGGLDIPEIVGSPAPP